MPIYKVMYFDYGGHVWSEQELRCETDREAITVAHQLHILPMIDGLDIWQGERLVHRYRRSSHRGSAARH